MIGWPGRRPRPAPVPTAIVFLGDSLTAFWSAADPALFRPGRINEGVAGETSGQMRDRFDRCVAAHRPRAVHIMAGTNDLWRGQAGIDAADTIAIIMAMAAQAHAHGIRPLIAAVPPIGPPAAAEFAQAALRPVLNAGIGEQCRRAGIAFVDYAPALADAAGGIRRAFTTDGVHLTRRGYRALRGTAQRALGAVLADA